MRNRTDDRYRPRSADRRVVIISRDASRTFTIRPWLATSITVLGLALSIAYLGATSYLVFRDDLINATFERSADLQQAYEDRIAGLRQEIDRITSRQLLDQVAFDEKLERVLANQKALDDRSRLVSDVIDRARRNGIIGGAGERADADPVVTGTTNAYASDTASEIEQRFAALTDPAAKADRPGIDLAPEPVDLIGRDGQPDFRAFTQSLAEIDREQTDAVRSIAAAIDARATAVENLVEDLGVRLKLPETAAIAETTDADAVGGPYIPLGSPESLGMALAEVDAAFVKLDHLRGAIGSVPVATPIPGAQTTSNFGSRSDPFLGSAAFHAGIDFRSPVGRDVNATAAGRVVFAGRNGGYGNMVEIDHGNGLTTRYAHMSRILVEQGERVAAGARVGEVGSTGRSTGPHLHYETRINGTAVNPMTYLSTGRKIAALLQ